MYFIPRTSTWYSTVAAMSPLQRYGLVTVIALLVLVSWLYGIYYPIAKKITYYRQEIASLHTATRTMHATQQTIDELLVANELLKNSKTPISERSELQVNHRITHFLQDAHDAGVELHDLIVPTTGSKTLHSIKQPLSCTIKGKMDQLLYFLQKIIHHQKPLIIKQMELVSQDGARYLMKAELCILIT